VSREERSGTDPEVIESVSDDASKAHGRACVEAVANSSKFPPGTTSSRARSTAASSSIAADWFEVTNVGTAAANILLSIATTSFGDVPRPTNRRMRPVEFSTTP
jgi:hypothetical protein